MNATTTSQTNDTARRDERTARAFPSHSPSRTAQPSGAETHAARPSPTRCKPKTDATPTLKTPRQSSPVRSFHV